MKKKRINYFKYFSLLFVIAVLVFIAECTGASPIVPIINSFSANPHSITEGESSTLSWSVTDATSVTIDNGIGSVTLSTGTFTVSPRTTTTYTLTSTNTAGSVTATRTVTVSSAIAVSIGDSYGGGIVAYILQDGDPGYVANEQHGLIAAINDQNIGIEWITGGDTQTTLNGNTLTALGTGQLNTNAMKAQTGYTGGAAQVCDEYSVTVDSVTYEDWFLPSLDELNKLYISKAQIGHFAAGWYWSSSEYDEDYADLACAQGFSHGQYIYCSKYLRLSVRAVRAF